MRCTGFRGSQASAACFTVSGHPCIRQRDSISSFSAWHHSTFQKAGFSMASPFEDAMRLLAF
ncbi:hypothetical protein BIFDEN_01944 [Bifidobacterium dentium ATCC 27678]|nr:hypothetical protein BIFDEN_01944 [Bifidobacterium dentium ATCC 27678]